MIVSGETLKLWSVAPTAERNGCRRVSDHSPTGHMSNRTFQEAYDRVRSRYDDLEWQALTPRQIADAIYREIRAIDAENNSEPGEGEPKSDQQE